MLVDTLKEIEASQLRAILLGSFQDTWNSVDITFHPPHVERLWRPWGHGYRINLQIIHPCKPEESLYHPHATPIAIKIFGTGYRMLTGHGPNNDPPPLSYHYELPEGTYYEMIHPDAWHAECPENSVPTIALTGKPWPRPWVPKSPHPLAELSPTRKGNILKLFSEIYR